MSNSEFHKARAKQCAKRDHERGLPSDAARHHARPGSAWATWYETEYAALASQ